MVISHNAMSALMMDHGFFISLQSRTSNRASTLPSMPTNNKANRSRLLTLSTQYILLLRTPLLNPFYGAASQPLTNQSLSQHQSKVLYPSKLQSKWHCSYIQNKKQCFQQWNWIKNGKRLSNFVPQLFLGEIWIGFKNTLLEMTLPELVTLAANMMVEEVVVTIYTQEVLEGINFFEASSSHIHCSVTNSLKGLYSSKYSEYWW